MADGSNFIQYAPNGEGGEQGLEFLSKMRFNDEDGEDKDGFFHADGPDLISVPVPNTMKPCMRKFTYAEERGGGRERGRRETNGTLTSIPRKNAGILNGIAMS